MYKQRILATEIVLPNPNTLFIDTNIMEVIAGLTENKRTEFIEYLCGSTELVEHCQNIVTKLNVAKIKFNATNAREKFLAEEKKKIAKEIESVVSWEQTVQEYNDQVLQFSLFRMFHNEEFAEAVEQKVESERAALEHLKGKRAKNFDELKGKVEQKKKLEGEKMEVDVEMRIMKEEAKEVQWKCLKQQRKVESAMRDKELAGQLQETVEKFQKKVDDAEAEIAQLLVGGEKHQELLKHKATFDELKHNFNNDQDTLGTQLDIRVRKYLCGEEEEKTLRLSISEYEELLKQHREEYNLHEQKLKASKALRGQTGQEVYAMEQQVKEFEKNLTKLQQKPEHSVASHDNIIADLQKKFPSRVFGRLSQLYTVNGNERDRKFIEKILGSSSRAIVVDNKVTENACFDFLKLKQLTQFDETFLTLSDFINAETTNVKIPRNFPAKKIESFVNCESKEVKKVMMKCLKPAIICETLEMARKAKTMKEFKNVKVLSMEGFADDFEKNSELEKQKLMEMKVEVEMNAPKLILLRRKLVELDFDIDLLEMETKKKKQSCENYSEQLKKYQEDFKEFDEDEERNKNRKMLKRFEASFEKMESEYFKEFCEICGFENVREFSEALESSSPEVIDRKVERLRKKIDEHNEEITRNQAMIREIPTVTDEGRKLQEIVDDKISRIKGKIDESIVKETKIQEVSQQIFASDQEFMQEIFESYNKIYDDLNRLQENFTENFDTITNIFMEQLPLSVKSGSLKDFIMPPEKVPKGSHLVKDQLKKIEFNFDQLKRNLKEKVDDVAKTSQELLAKINKLAINASKAIFPDDKGEISLTAIAGKMKTINKLLRQQQAVIDRIQGELDDVKNQRSKTIVESLAVMNEVISEFYNANFDGRVVASLELTSPNPAIDSAIAFNYLSIDSPPQKITATSQDFTAALAFVFGILKKNQQKFVVLNSATHKVTDNVENFFKTQNYIQVINFTKLFRDESSNYAIQKNGQGFSIKHID